MKDEIEQEIERLSNQVLETKEKPNYSKRTFMNSVVIMMHCLTDQLTTNADSVGIDHETQMELATRAGLELKSFIFKHTGIDTHDISNYI
jgi:hypothetical protein